jgi:hypothetical protein
LGLQNEPFDSQFQAESVNGWTGLNNAVPNNSYGFSATNFTGGASSAGEAGGFMARNGVTSYYADTNLMGTLVRSDAIEASGEFDITSLTTHGAFNNLLSIGHFDSTLSGAVDFIGFDIIEIDAGSVRMRARLEFGDAISLTGNIINVTGFPNSDRLWSYTWDPTGGTTGDGLLTFTIDGPANPMNVSTIDVANAASPLNLDAFGLLDLAIGVNDDNNTARLFIDDVTYTSYVPPVPEPSTLVLGLGGIGIAVCVRRRRRGN